MNKTEYKAGRLLKHSTIYAIGTVLRQLTSFLMLPVYTRFLSPADYGVVGLLTFTLALIEPFFGARLGDAIPKFYLEKDTDENRRSVLSAALTITGAVSGIAAVLIFLCRNSASALVFGSDKFGVVIGIFGFQIVTQAIEYYGLTFVRIQQKPLLFISISITKLAFQLGLNIWLIAVLKMGVMGVIISGGISSALFALGLTSYMLFVTGYRFDLTMAKRMLAFSWPLWFSGLAGLYIFQSNRYYIRFFGSLDELGLFELAMKFAGILSFLAWGPFAQVWDVERFNHHRSERAGELYGNIFRMISVFLIVVALGICIFASPAIRIMSSIEFHKADLSVPFLTAAMVFSCLTSFLNFSFLISEQTKQITWNNYITMALITALNLLLIPQLGEIGAAVALMFAMIFQFLITNRTARKLYDMNIRLIPLASTLTIGVIGYLFANYAVDTEYFLLNLTLKATIYAAFVAIMGSSVWKDPNIRPFILTMFRPLMGKFNRPK